MNRDMAFEQKVRDMLHRGESESFEGAEFKTRVKEGYQRLGELAKKPEDKQKLSKNAEEMKRRVAEEFRQKAMSSRKVQVQNYFDVPK